MRCFINMCHLERNEVESRDLRIMMRFQAESVRRSLGSRCSLGMTSTGTVYEVIYFMYTAHFLWTSYLSGGMTLTDKDYEKLVDSMSPKSPMGRDCFNAFWIGGLICTLGQVFINLYTRWGLEKQDASTAASMTLVALSALLTGLSLYDDIAKHAGAGTLVPITGFANAIAAPAVEYKTEGFILGVGAKMFTIAGPVIVYGVSASVVYGFIYWIWTMM